MISKDEACSRFMKRMHYRARILMGGGITLAILLGALSIMGAMFPSTHGSGLQEDHARTVQAVTGNAAEESGTSSDTGLTLERAIRIARQNGVDSTFLARLASSPATMIQPRVLKINITNFAHKTDYSHNYNDASIRKVRAFLQENDSLLHASAVSFDVPEEVIASILWVETKFGTVMGATHVPSVYLSLMLCKDSTLIEQHTLSALKELKADSTKYDSVKAIVKAKATKKWRWAVDQLKALDSIQRDGTLDVISLRGSWAGAFGLGQFIPSSYRSWAVDGNNDKEINLNHLSDAVHSVANYLSKNGWGPTIKQRRGAVRHYNNSDAYVDAVFTLAAKVQN